MRPFRGGALSLDRLQRRSGVAGLRSAEPSGTLMLFDGLTVKQLLKRLQCPFCGIWGRARLLHCRGFRMAAGVLGTTDVPSTGHTRTFRPHPMRRADSGGDVATCVKWMFWTFPVRTWLEHHPLEHTMNMCHITNSWDTEVPSSSSVDWDDGTSRLTSMRT